MVEYHSRMERRRATELENQGVKGGAHTKKKSSGGGKKKRGWFKRILIIFFLLVLFFILAGAVTVFAIIRNAPPLNENALRNPVSSVIYDENNHLATSVDPGQHRSYTSINDIPMVVQDAYISTEDVRFYQHFGIDPYRILGAGVAQFTRGYKSEGASTITQQVVRNAMLTQNKTFTRKIQEMYLAIQLEKKYTKKQILEMYLNQIYLGGGPVYGVAAASEKYFGTNIKNVTLPQAAMLAAMTRNPGYYDPILHPTEAKARRDLVLDLMVQNKAITPAQAAQAKAVSMKEMTKGHKNLPVSNRKYGAFVDYVRRTILADKSLGITDKDFSSGGLKIYTTLDPAIQQKTQNILNNKKNFPTVQKNFQAGVSVIDTQTGAIRALGGGRDYYYSDFNWADRSSRSIGSTAKPIVDYGPAIEYLKWPTDYTVDDKKGTTYTNGPTVNDWDGRFLGKMTMRKALYLSRNVPAVKTLQTINQQTGSTNDVLSFAGQLGFHWPTTGPNAFNETYAIGSFGSSPLQMAGAYAAFGNNGVYNQPYAIRKIVKPDGEVINFDHTRHIAMHDYTAYMITNMLEDVMTKGTGIHADIPGVALAGKTGTQNIDSKYAQQYHISQSGVNYGATDSWFVGYTSRLTTSVWTGYTNVGLSLKNSKLYGSYLAPNEQGYASLIFRDIMSGFMPGAPDFIRPDSVVSLSGGELGVRNSTVSNHFSATSSSSSSSSSTPASSSSSSSSSSSAPVSSSSSSSSSSSAPASVGSSSPSTSSSSGLPPASGSAPITSAPPAAAP
ncbi:PBP1A family penicillin-binding protein [Sporolactobacillus shoreae]|uniref:PBP1A family penicillin-binding protein n=1 Tax=Sporolactobacillus shoreae TaxID=1465501 RepID=A0A4Z0GMQ0_9BACL|nr:PBP1A family penicillin-binding protein [Sporolactobacillus shoreae]TGA97040.1 PBP1A family penicillin-binding protein [Sporolactobacillus shoreae]